jgi:epoxide hydrolase-like predicted phosphatase
MKYRAVGFDYGGVLYGLPGKVFDANIAALLGVEVEDYRKVYFAHNTTHTDTWKMWQAVLADLQKEGLSRQVDKFTREWSKTKVIQKEVLELVKRLKRDGYKVGLLTNRAPKQAVRLRVSGIIDIFDVVCVSSEIGYAKPDPRAYAIFCDQLDIKPEELIFIDDEVSSLTSAANVGYRPILFESYGVLVKTLDDLGVG